jgi:hypothetical protein
MSHSDDNVHSSNPNNNFDSNSSVGASSCGENDSHKPNKKPSWRNYSTAAVASNNNNYSNNQYVKSTSSVASNNTMTVNADMIERMVDERVQSQLREVEARMETLLRRWMDQMNTKITSRLDSMEASIKDSMPASTADPVWRHEI